VTAASRLNVRVSGRPDGQPVVFAHGFGCDQHMWRFVAPAFEDRFRVVLFDQIGAGGSDPLAFDPERYATLGGYAQDVLDICHELELHDVVLVGHSVAAMVAVLAEIAEPDLFDKLVLVSPSPRYIDDASYVGGFTGPDIQELLDYLDSNYLGWSATMAPVIMGRPDRPDLGAELTESFCRMDPVVARHWARVTFLSDSRADLPRVSTPTLVLQCRSDVIAPPQVGEYVRDAIPGSRLVLLDAVGHCPNLSAPEDTTRAIADFVRVGVGT
jgi:sigma-B regulation protein RsbQ